MLPFNLVSTQKKKHDRDFQKNQKSSGGVED